MNLLEIRNITKKYVDKTALDNVSINIKEGRIFGLLGPNGAGKTSLIRIINQITYPDKGEIIFNGEPLSGKHISQIGYMPEERGLYKSMKVGEQALYLAQLKGMSKEMARKELRYWFDKLEIGDWWNKKIQELSKGMAQKIQFVVTVLHKPKLLILDEPFSGFDPVNANIVQDEIINLKKQGTTIIFSTHRMESVEEMCDDVALIHKSKKLIDGSLSDVKKQYRTHSYRVGINTSKENELLQALQKYEVSKTSFKSLDDELQLNINLGNHCANELMQILIEHGSLTHFSENIPTINDIFIKTVTA